MSEVAAIRAVRRARSRPARRHGSWKVAFADFATALMALFMVLWLMNSNPETRQAIAEYFNDPQAASGLPTSRELAEQIEIAILEGAGLKALEEQIDISLTAEGLRIELIEEAQGTFFENGGALPTSVGVQAIEAIAGQLNTFGSDLVVEGHTDAKPFPAGGRYSNWELSTDRANSARRLLLAGGVDAGRIAEVRGFASTRPYRDRPPEDPSNRRVSLIARF